MLYQPSLEVFSERLVMLADIHTRIHIEKHTLSLNVVRLILEPKC